MALPKISIEFKSTGITAINRGQRGVVALIVNDINLPKGLTTLYGVADLDESASTSTVKQVELAFIGGVNSPTKVLLYNEAEATPVNHTEALTELEKHKFDYLAIPSLIAGQELAVVTWIKRIRDELEQKSKVVLPKTAGDYEGVINFTAEDIKVGETTYTTAQYCSRIAGLLAGTPLQISATYHVLSEVEDVKRFTVGELNTKIDAGEFVLLHDGEKVKVGRAVNSLTTTTEVKGQDWKKIKVVDILDLIFSDIKTTSEDNYIGKYSNKYDNKVLLINAINGYLLQLEADGLLDEGVNNVGVNVDAQRTYLQSIGVDVTGMNEQQVKEANTKDKVFLGGSIKVLDAIEDIDLDLSL